MPVKRTRTLSSNKKGVVIDEAKAVERHKKAKAAAAASHTTFDMDDEGDMFEYDETNQKLREGMAASRRCTIAFFFEYTYGAPPSSATPARPSWGSRLGRKNRMQRNFRAQNSENGGQSGASRGSVGSLPNAYECLASRFTVKNAVSS
jgi:hypothetical protein